MRISSNSHNHPHSNRRGLIRTVKLAASAGLGLFAAQLAIGSAGLYYQARSLEFSQRWPYILMVAVGITLLYRAASAPGVYLLGRSPSWAWRSVRGRIARAVRRPVAA